MKLYIPDPPNNGLYHLCPDSTNSTYLFSTYKVKKDYIVCNLRLDKIKKCSIKIPIVFMFPFDSLTEQQSSTIILLKDFKGQIIEMEDNFGDR